jgi:exosortase A-associated hydrolase 1
MTTETAVRFDCQGDTLVGILHPARAGGGRRLGVLIIVGGPQYRVGSHRQFVLLARHLAAQGFPTLRFDCRGMGDSGGEFPGFEHISDDVTAALDQLCHHARGLERVVLWGLCDAASAALMQAPRDARIAGLVLLNPWVRTSETLARAYLRHYYVRRLVSPEFWSELLRGRSSPLRIARDLLGNLRQSRGAGPAAETHEAADATPFVERMRRGLERFRGPVLLILSGKDITAAEFADLATTPAWQRVLARPGVTWHRMPEATHTFPSETWRHEVAETTAAWLAGVEATDGGRAP